MANQTKNGGQAFPRGAGPEGASYCNGELGMTLRDYFAGQALAGLVQFADAPTALKPWEMAEAAYKIARAMIAEREKPEQQTT